MMKFSVVIATRNRADRLDAALTSLRLQGAAPPTEIIVVDNGSSDNTREVTERHGARYVFEPIANRARARNRGVAVASGSHLLFVDDDVVVPAGFVGMHARAHDASIFPRAVSGPIINVPGSSDRPAPSAANYSAAFFCTCNVSVRASALAAVGGFDEQFDLYGWEDTELGLRLRAFDVQRHFEWDAYLWHIKTPGAETLDALLEKTLEKARMAARLVRKSPTPRAKLATGAYGANLLRAKALAPRAAQPFFAGLATSPRAPQALARFARGRLLDSLYADELERALGRDR
jgi:glycosyltransferase involved in cell wall biosynthesis